MENEMQTGYLGAFGQSSGLSLAARVQAAREQNGERIRSAAAEAQWAELTDEYTAMASRIDALDDPTADEVDTLHDLLTLTIRRLDRRQPAA
jgi:hypothetical protein